MKHYLNQKKNEKSVITTSGSDGAGYMEDIVKEIGQALSQSQEKLDEILIESQQLRLKELLANPKLILPQASSFVLPEAKLDLNMQVKGKYDSVGSFKIETKPHNAKTQAKSNVNQEVSSKISLKFAMVPDEGINENNIPKPTSKQRIEDIRAKALEEINKHNDKRKVKIEYTSLTLEYIRDSRKWYVSTLDADEIFAILIFDDTSGEFLELLLLSPKNRTIDDISELASPIISSVNKQRATSGETVTITGENLGALNMADTTITLDGKKITPLEVSFEQITFKITPDLTSGYLKVTTPEGTFQHLDQLVINATPLRFETNSSYGYFNPENKLGSTIKIVGENISPETKLKFANGELAHLESHTSTLAQFRVPENARSGPVSFLTRDEELGMEQIFYLRPFIKSITPKEARHNELVRITGNHFSNVTQLKIGDQSFNLSHNTEEEGSLYAIKSDQSLLIAIPDNAGDGRLYLFSHHKWWDTNTFFYQVPSITGVPEYVVVGTESLIHGYGFGKSHQGLYLEFEQNEVSIIEASYVDKTDEQQVLGFGLKPGAFTDKVRIIRADIASDEKYDETTTLWNRKIPVFRQGTFDEHILWCSPIWNGLSEHWGTEGFELLPNKIIKKREENGILSLNQALPVSFSFYGEFYNIDNLQVQLDLLDDSQIAHGHLKISLDNESIVFHLSHTNATISYPTNLIMEGNGFDRLFLRLHFNEAEFSLSINEHAFGWFLNDADSDVAVLLKDYMQLQTARKLHLIPSEESFTSAVILSKYDSLVLPDFSKFVWDFDTEALLKEIVGYELDDIEKFPTTANRVFKITGSGFTKFSAVMINDIRLDTIFNSTTELEVDLHDSPLTNGELYVFDYLNPNLRSRSVTFRIIQEAEIYSSPEHIAAGDPMILRGDHFTENGLPSVYVEKFGPLEVLEITNELIKVIAPKLTIVNAKLRLVYDENTIKISPTLVNVSALNNYNFLRNAHHADWQLPSGEILPFASEASISEGFGSVAVKDNVTLDDNNVYARALVITCPNSEFRHIDGRFEDFYLPSTCELSFELGFLQEASQTDGVRFSVFIEKDGIRQFFIDRAFETYGDALSKFTISYQGEGKKGTLVIRVEPGSSGFDDHLAIVKAELKFTHVVDGWTMLFGSDKTNVLTIPGTRNEVDARNMPGARSFSAVWQDLKGKIWLFGGYGNDANPRSGQLNDLWTYDGDNWTWVKGLSTTNGFSKFSNTPGEITTPGGRHGTAFWQDSEGVFWMFGGHGYHISGRQRSLNDLWKFTEDDGWEMMAISNDWKDDDAHGTYGDELIMLDEHKREFTTEYWPLTRVHPSFWYDDETGLLWLFGGEYRESGKPEYHISDLWTFDGDTWELKNGDGTQNYTPDLQNKRPSARSGAATWTDDSGKLWLFGGYGVVGNQVRSLNDLWHFKKNKWTMVKDNHLVLNDSFVQQNKRPGPRAYASVWKDTNGVVWMFGGEGSNTDSTREAPLNDLWKITNGQWSYVDGPLEMRDMGNATAPKIPYPDSWPSSRYGAACWLNPTGWLMMYGGKGYGESRTTGNKSLGRLQQMWQFSPSS
ncbi:IPT/TIG domain-containing protein [Ekhidna sp.]|uniref:Kelch repeat-containing protein n=1 Tax=Ekhidna sp. TaxID=2608089 RepID=UPI003298DBDE